jgi:hypothetical protein
MEERGCNMDANRLVGGGGGGAVGGARTYSLLRFRQRSELRSGKGRLRSPCMSATFRCSTGRRAEGRRRPSCAPAVHFASRRFVQCGLSLSCLINNTHHDSSHVTGWVDSMLHAWLISLNNIILCTIKKISKNQIMLNWQCYIYISG